MKENTKENTILKNMEMAYKAIEDSFETIGEKDDKKILKEYKGYIASFCTTLRQLGLMAALLNYYESEIYLKEKSQIENKNQDKTKDDKKENPKAQSHHLVAALAKMSNDNDTLAFMNKIYNLAVHKDKTEYKKKEEQIAEHAITLKKTLRLFKIQS